MTKTVSLEEAWAAIAAFVEANEPAGEIRIQSGKDTGQWVSIKPSRIPPNVGLELVRQGIIKPITDISKDAKQGDESWKEPHARRTKKVELWYGGDYAAKGGGVADPVGAQMKVEFTGQLKAAGVGLKTHADLFKGSVGQMLDACIAAGIKLDKESKMSELRDIAVARLAERGKAAESLDLSNLSL
jgi:hypothetical protein